MSTTPKKEPTPAAPSYAEQAERGYLGQVTETLPNAHFSQEGGPPGTTPPSVVDESAKEAGHGHGDGTGDPAADGS